MAKGLKHHHTEGYEHAPGNEANAEAHKIVPPDLARSFVAAEFRGGLTLTLNCERFGEIKRYEDEDRKFNLEFTLLGACCRCPRGDLCLPVH